MKVSYDFHIHTDLSPCGDECMTPNNIIQMAKLVGKQIIAITDHNSCRNCEVTMKLGEKEGIVVIPGMEIECMEEFHLIVLFTSIEKAYAFEQMIEPFRLPIVNKPHIYGHQYVLGYEDEIVEEYNVLLVTAIQKSVEELVDMVRSLDGIIYPAHIDRKSYSILSNLGSIPEELGFKILEISRDKVIENYQNNYSDYNVIRGSDGHYMEDFCQNEQFIELDSVAIEEVFKCLK